MKTEQNNSTVNDHHCARETKKLPDIRLPNIAPQKSNELSGDFGKTDSDVLDRALDFLRFQERLNRKRKHSKKKKTTVHINVASEQYPNQNHYEHLKPNIIASGTQYFRPPERVTTHVTYTTSPLGHVTAQPPSPLPIRHLENDGHKFHRLVPPLYKSKLLSRSDSRISVLKDKSESVLPNFGSTRDIRIARDKPVDIPKPFAVNSKEENASPLNKFAPLPPIFGNPFSSDKKLKQPTLHPQE